MGLRLLGGQIDGIAVRGRQEVRAELDAHHVLQPEWPRRQKSNRQTVAIQLRPQHLLIAARNVRPHVDRWRCGLCLLDQLDAVGEQVLR